MKKFFYSLGTALIVFAVAVAGWWVGRNKIFERENIVEGTRQAIEKPFEKYAVENLANIKIQEGEIKILDDYLFEFYFNPNLDGKTIKKTTGQIRIPEGKGPFPLVLMLRGYVDQEIYQTGVGTSRAAEVFAQNGYLTLAPDFFGYAASDQEADNIFEARFQTYVTALALLNSLDQIDSWDDQNVFLWGHSNGGHRLLSPSHIQFFTILMKAMIKENSSDASWLNLKTFTTPIFFQSTVTMTASMLKFSFIRARLTTPFQLLGVIIWLKHLKILIKK